MKPLRIGTRGSRLALSQAQLAREALQGAFKGLETEIKIIKTKGDRILDRPFSQVGEKGIFASELEQALLEGEIDLAVHSAKDLPATLAFGLCIAGVLQRADARDVLVTRKTEAKGKDTPFRLGTGSKRRVVLAQQLWENVDCRGVRGNVETRLHKLEMGEYDALLLAKAGLDRLQIDEISYPALRFYPLEPALLLPAACQGIVALEVVKESRAFTMAAAVSHRETMLAFEVERRVLSLLQADCSQPVGALFTKEQGTMRLEALYGTKRKAFTCSGFCREKERPNALALAERAAGWLLEERKD